MGLREISRGSGFLKTIDARLNMLLSECMAPTSGRALPPSSLLRKLIISLFIIACIWIQIARNTYFSLGALSIWIVRPFEEKEGALNRIGKALHSYFENDSGKQVANYIWKVSRASHFFGQGAGLVTLWRMFTPIPTSRWRNRYYGIYADGSDRLLPLPLQSERRFLDRFFFDFREAKFQVNMFYFPGSRRQYANYLCRIYKSNNQGREISSIKRVLQAQKIYSPAEAREKGRFLEETIGTVEEEKFPCENFP